jgi:hypothetical protein
MPHSVRLFVLYILCSALLVVCWSGRAHAAPDACEVAAREELKRREVGAVVVSARLGERELVTPKACPAQGKCIVLLFQTVKKPAIPRKPEEAFVGEERWSPVADAEATCPLLKSYTFTKTTAASGDRPAAGNAASKAPVVLPTAGPSELATAQAALDAFRSERRGITGATRALGSAQIGAGEVAAEALQILGQIVVDRASAKAYRLLEEKLKQLLGCADASPKFPRTCSALGALRLQDIAMAPAVLAEALGADTIERSVAAWPEGRGAGLRAAFRLGIQPWLARGAGSGDAQVRLALGALVNEVARGTAALGEMTPGERALAIAVLAYTDCLKSDDGTPVTRNELLGCDVTALVERYAAGAPDARDAALALGTRLLTIAAAADTNSERVRFAVDTFFVTACMLERTSTTADLSCPALETLPLPPKPLDPLGALSFTAATADAIAARDWARLVVIGSKLVVFVEGACASCQEAASQRKRALRLMGALLDYADTYAARGSREEGGDAADDGGSHAQRTKILESLTEEMTDRSGRGGDDVFALGGSLRLLAGARIGVSRPGASFAGPLSLPLGVSYTHIPRRENAWGVHVQLDAVDLGNYLALDNEPNVKTPELGDAFAPGLTLGLAYGPSFPLVIGVSGNYMPAFVLDPDHEHDQGVITAGVTFGVHVPLLDLN